MGELEAAAMTTASKSRAGEGVGALCSHLQAGLQTTYMEYDGKRWCLDCIASIYEKTGEERLKAGWLLARRINGRRY